MTRTLSGELDSPVVTFWSAQPQSEIWSSNLIGLGLYADIGIACVDLEAGIVGTNNPSACGVRPMCGVKLSGLGQEGASVELEEFLDTRCLAWRP